MHKSKNLALLLLLLLLAGAATNAAAKSYSLQKSDVRYTISTDGLVEAEEKITFNFSGDFSFAYRDIPKGAWSINNVSVSDITSGTPQPLQFELIDNGTDTRMRWYYSAHNETKTFSLRYTLSNAVTAYNDVAEFYWKVWGSGWEVPLNELYGEIELPEAVNDAKEVYSWGHPAINGKIGLVDNKKLAFQAFGIPSGQWVEIRMAFPATLLKSRANAVVESGNGLQKIIDEEAGWQASETALGFIPIIFSIMTIAILALAVVLRKDRQKAGRAIIAGMILLTSIVFLPLIAMTTGALSALLFFAIEIAVFALCWHFLGREPAAELDAIYEREVPYDYSPAVVSALMIQTSKKPPLECITAEILDLCMKGKMQIRPIKKQKVLGIFGSDDFEIRILNRDMAGVPESEQMVFQLLANAAATKYEGIIFKKKVSDATPDLLTLEELRKYLLAD
ncbi:MAG: DUF2207 domain-containing protein, partial [Candidatus Diapherotrites archaeon]|nr:DUF2207 domain-containing protein [Candidatus Diapherotrites archaeon]